MSTVKTALLNTELKMTLSQAQAEAVYAAMVALNNVGGRVACKIQDHITVGQMVSGSIFVQSKLLPGEHYIDQAAFAEAYKLN